MRIIRLVLKGLFFSSLPCRLQSEQVNRSMWWRRRRRWRQRARRITTTKSQPNLRCTRQRHMPDLCCCCCGCYRFVRWKFVAHKRMQNILCNPLGCTILHGFSCKFNYSVSLRWLLWPNCSYSITNFNERQTFLSDWLHGRAGQCGLNTIQTSGFSHISSMLRPHLPPIHRSKSETIKFYFVLTPRCHRVCTKSTHDIISYQRVFPSICCYRRVSVGDSWQNIKF